MSIGPDQDSGGGGGGGGGGLGTPLWQQYRQIEFSGHTCEWRGENDDIDMKLSVTDAKNEGLSFEATVYNLAPESWQDVRVGDDCNITLGWTDGPQRQIISGTIKDARHDKQQTDTMFKLTGVDKSVEELNASFAQTWRDQSPTQIARAIATHGAVGLRPGHMDPCPPIEGRYAIRKDRPVRYWLGELLHEAQRRTSVQWEWDAHGGQLDFKRVESPTEPSVILSYDRSLLSVEPASGLSDSDDGREINFRAMIQPSLRRNARVSLQTDDTSGDYRVTEVQFKSDSTTGDHLVSGRLVPAGTQHSVEYPRGSGGAGGAGGDVEM